MLYHPIPLSHVLIHFQFSKVGVYFVINVLAMFRRQVKVDCDWHDAVYINLYRVYIYNRCGLVKEKERKSVICSINVEFTVRTYPSTSTSYGGVTIKHALGRALLSHLRGLCLRLGFPFLNSLN